MKVRPATLADVFALGSAGLRTTDVLELQRMDGCDPDKALRDGFEISDVCIAVEHEGRVVALCGVARKSALAGTGVVWLLGSEDLESCWYGFGKESKRVVDILTDEYGLLENFVDAKNERTIRWLKWLGFEVSEELAISPLGHPFRHFWRKRDV